jgi:hypothetical protein
MERKTKIITFCTDLANKTPLLYSVLLMLYDSSTNAGTGRTGILTDRVHHKALVAFF